MRVLLVSGSFPPMTCGVGDYTHALAGALAGCAGTEVGVLTSTAADRNGARGVEIMAVMHDWRRGELRAALAVIRAWRPDVVHIQYTTRGYRGILPYWLPPVLRARGVPVVQTWHEYFPRTGSFLDLAYVTYCELPIAVFGRDVIVVRPAFRENMPPWFRALTARKRFELIPNAPTVPRISLDAAGRARVRARWGAGDKALLAFFGFCYENKGIDDLLAAMDLRRHHLVLVGPRDEADPYQTALARRIAEPPLAGHVTAAGFLPSADAAEVLAAADAVVLPFRSGGGDWNTSMKAAALQGTFVLTTSETSHGYDERANVYRAHPRDPADLASALERFAGRRNPSPSPEVAGPDWPEIALRHLEVYRRSL